MVEANAGCFTVMRMDYDGFGDREKMEERSRAKRDRARSCGLEWECCDLHLIASVAHTKQIMAGAGMSQQGRKTRIQNFRAY